VDETKRAGLLIAAVVIPTTELTSSRRAVRSVFLGNQRRIHFKDERDSRKHQILNIILGLSLTARLYQGDGRAGELQARQACLRQLVVDVAGFGATRLVIEQDDSLVRHDRHTLYEAVAKAGCRDIMRYDHMRAHQECLLSIADGVAWCWSRGREWRSRVASIVTETVRVP
jgi:hypothetical protein